MLARKPFRERIKQRARLLKVGKIRQRSQVRRPKPDSPAFAFRTAVATGALSHEEALHCLDCLKEPTIGLSR